MTQSAIEIQLVNQLQTAHAMETNVRAQLESMINDVQDPDVLNDLTHHRDETDEHLKRLSDRLTFYGDDPSTLKDLTGLFAAVGKVATDTIKGQTTATLARDAYVTEHLEIATYELLERIATFAGDSETAEVAQQNRADEEAMAKKIAKKWDLFAKRELAEQNIVIADDKANAA